MPDKVFKGLQKNRTPVGVRGSGGRGVKRPATRMSRAEPQGWFMASLRSAAASSHRLDLCPNLDLDLDLDLKLSLSSSLYILRI